MVLISGGVFFLGLGLGVFLQQNHALRPLKRFFQGRPLSIPPPSHTILNWELEKRLAFIPEYNLSELSLSEIESNRSLYVKKLEELIRLPAFPQDHPSKTRIIEKVELPKVFREKIEIEVEPGLWIPFYLFIPKGGKEPMPCVLVFHGHSTGKIETAGIVRSYQKGNALALAEAGYVTVTSDLRGFGELGWIGEWEDPLGHGYARSIHIQDVIHNLREGRTTLGSFIHDSRKILDYLKQRKEVDSERIGVTGTSMGADVAIWMTILDSRVKIVVASSSPLLDFPATSIDYGEFHPCIHTIPGIWEFFRLSNLSLLVAPRPFFLDLQKFQGRPPTIQPRLEELYREAGSPEKLAFRFHSDGDTFHNEPAIEWFKKWL